jgi:hypothetical protein
VTTTGWSERSAVPALKAHDLLCRDIAALVPACDLFLSSELALRAGWRIVVRRL